MTKKTKASSPPAVQDLDDREVQRLAYINICRNLAEPLQMFLDHPFTPKESADKISNLIGDILNDSLFVVGNGQFAADQLLAIANGHAKTFEPTWAKPLSYYISQALEDKQTPTAFHNALIDAVDYLVDQFNETPAQTVRRRFVDCLTRTIAGESE